MIKYNKDRAIVLGLLSQKGLVSSQELQDFSLKSQATVSRILDDLSGQVLVFGRARATRYGLPKSIHGHGAQQPLWWTDTEGRAQQIGTLSLLTGNTLLVETDHLQTVTTGALPWFLAPRPLRQTSCRLQIHADDPRRSDTKCKEIDIHKSFKNRH